MLTHLHINISLVKVVKFHKKKTNERKKKKKKEVKPAFILIFLLVESL